MLDCLSSITKNGRDTADNVSDGGFFKTHFEYDTGVTLRKTGATHNSGAAIGVRNILGHLDGNHLGRERRTPLLSR